MKPLLQSLGVAALAALTALAFAAADQAHLAFIAAATGCGLVADLWADATDRSKEGEAWTR